MTEKKRQALGRLHAWRRGRRNHVPMAEGLVASVRDLTKRQDVSLKQLAAEAGVSDRSLRRWLAGEDHPAPPHVKSLRSAVARLDANRRLPHA